MQALLLDLDGTLLDSAPDLVDALNQVLIAENHAPVALSTAQQWASHGGLYMVCQAFHLQADDERAQTLRQRLVAIYAEQSTRYSRLFEGMTTVLAFARAREWRWGIVTNKPAWLTDPLIEKLSLTPDCVVSGDTLTESKPHPAPLWYACEQMQVVPVETVYVGDAQRDIEAGQRAGMRTIVALYGYIGEHDQPEQWGATAMVESPSALRTWLAENE